MEDKVHQTPWKRFVYFINDEVVQFKLENLCKLFCKYGVLDIVTDFLLDVFLTDSEHKCEATWLLNELFIGTTSVYLFSTFIVSNCRKSAQ